MKHEYFPPEILALQEEVAEHPPLQLLLSELPGEADSLGIRLGCIAAYCEIILMGVYSEAEILKLCDTLTRKLQDKRKLLVINTPPPSESLH